MGRLSGYLLSVMLAMSVYYYLFWMLAWARITATDETTPLPREPPSQGQARLEAADGYPSNRRAPRVNWEAQQRPAAHQSPAHIDKMVKTEDRLTDKRKVVIFGKHNRIMDIQDYKPVHPWLQWQASRSGKKAGLADCAHNVTCLERILVPEVQLLVAKEGGFEHRYALHNTVYDYTHTSSVGDCEHANTLLIYVHSSPANFDLRQLIRQTWGSMRMERGFHVKVVFGLGRQNESRIQETVDEESAEYSDILQGDFLDTPRNLTLKLHMALNYVHEHCSDSSYFLKVHDGVFVNIYRVLDLVSDVMPWLEALTIMCAEVEETAIPDRNRKSLNYVSSAEYAPDVFPPMCPGPAYLMPTTLALRLAALAPYTRFLWRDDVWATGLLGLLAEARHVPLSHEPLSPYEVTVDHQVCFLDVPAHQGPANDSRTHAGVASRKHNIRSLYEETWKRVKRFGTSGQPAPFLPC